MRFAKFVCSLRIRVENREMPVAAPSMQDPSCGLKRLGAILRNEPAAALVNHLSPHRAGGRLAGWWRTGAP